MGVITHPFPNLSYYLLIKGAPGIIELILLIQGASSGLSPLILQVEEGLPGISDLLITGSLTPVSMPRGTSL